MDVEAHFDDAKDPLVIALVQRVRQARVEVGGAVVGAIGAGLLVLVCAEPADTAAQADRLVDKLLKLRIFSRRRPAR